MAEGNSKLRILAQPHPSHRERYSSELDPTRNRPQRFIRADTNVHNLDHPTLEVSKDWPFDRNLYFRVTLATALNDQVDVHCVHPYAIEPEDNAENVIRDANKNTLYFPITQDDVTAGYKSFRITRKKTVQHELRHYGRLRLLDSDQYELRLDDPTDARRLIEFYQLGKSQLVFSLAELIAGNPIPVIYQATTVLSNIMTAMTSTSPLNLDETTPRCAPQRGQWDGGEEVLMVLPNGRVDRRRSFRIVFEYPQNQQIEAIAPEFVDTRTVTFTTPPCHFQLNGQANVQVPLVFIQGNEEVARFDFLYQQPGQNFIYNQQATSMGQYFDDLSADLDFDFQ